MVDAVTLDLWYTLWYQRPNERADFRRRKRRVWSDCLRAAGASPAEVRTSSKALRLERLRHVVDGTAWSPRLAAAWLGKHAGIRVDVGALEFELDRVVAQIPETPMSIRSRLAEDGMMDWFDALAISSEVGWAKPDPRIFWDCLRRLRAPPTNSVHVGDLPADIRGARAAHMKAVWFWGADRWSSRADRSIRRSARLNLPRIRTWTGVAHALAARRRVDG
ncbi:MAG: HAD family hydrolase [Thermoplasmatales archaeon]|nr:HAD family hydrolase [Thermoplasmatales archaeon]